MALTFHLFDLLGRPHAVHQCVVLAHYILLRLQFDVKLVHFVKRVICVILMISSVQVHLIEAALVISISLREYARVDFLAIHFTLFLKVLLFLLLSDFLKHRHLRGGGQGIGRAIRRTYGLLSSKLQATKI